MIHQSMRGQRRIIKVGGPRRCPGHDLVAGCACRFEFGAHLPDLLLFAGGEFAPVFGKHVDECVPDFVAFTRRSRRRFFSGSKFWFSDFATNPISISASMARCTVLTLRSASVARRFRLGQQSPV
jgi:hypothetical protein